MTRTKRTKNERANVVWLIVVIVFIGGLGGFTLYGFIGFAVVFWEMGFPHVAFFEAALALFALLAWLYIRGGSDE